MCEIRGAIIAALPNLLLLAFDPEVLTAPDPNRGERSGGGVFQEGGISFVLFRDCQRACLCSLGRGRAVTEPLLKGRAW